MLIISGNRQSGKTMNLIRSYMIDPDHSCIIVPTHQQKRLVLKTISSLNKKLKPLVFSWDEYLLDSWGEGLRIEKIYIDDLLCCIALHAASKRSTIQAVVVDQ